MRFLRMPIGALLSDHLMYVKVCRGVCCGIIEWKGRGTAYNWPAEKSYDFERPPHVSLEELIFWFCGQ